MKTDEGLLLPEPLNRLNDVYFKYVLASPERKHITIDFLNAVLSHKVPEGEKPVVIEALEFLDRETTVLAAGMKGARFDVFVRSTDGRMFHVEVQTVREKFFMKRSFYYAAVDYTGQLERGMSYEKLEPVIFIGLMNFTLFGNSRHPEKWYSLHKFLDTETHECSLNAVEFHMVELPLLKKYLEYPDVKPKDKFEEILCYFGRIGGDELLEEIAERNPTVKELRLAESIFSKNPIAFRNYLINERARFDDENNRRTEREKAKAEGLELGRAEGLEQGLLLGKQENAVENARSLRSQGILTDEQIAQALSLPLEIVEKL